VKINPEPSASTKPADHDDPGFIGPWGEQSPEWRQQLASKGYTRKQSQTLWNGYCLTMGLLLLKLEQQAPDDSPGESIKDMLLRKADELNARLAAEAAEAEQAAGPEAEGGMSQGSDEHGKGKRATKKTGATPKRVRKSKRSNTPSGRASRHDA